MEKALASESPNPVPLGQFAQLPGEIRNQIYHLFRPAGYVDIHYPASQARALPALDLSRTCHQLKQRINSLEYDRPLYNFFRECRLNRNDLSGTYTRRKEWDKWMTSLSNDQLLNMRGLRYQDPGMTVRVQYSRGREVKCNIQQGWENFDAQRENAAEEVSRMPATCASEVKAVLEFLTEKVFWYETREEWHGREARQRAEEAGNNEEIQKAKAKEREIRKAWQEKYEDRKAKRRAAYKTK